MTKKLHIPDSSVEPNDECNFAWCGQNWCEMAEDAESVTCKSCVKLRDNLTRGLQGMKGI